MFLLSTNLCPPMTIVKLRVFMPRLVVDRDHHRLNSKLAAQFTTSSTCYALDHM